MTNMRLIIVLSGCILIGIAVNSLLFAAHAGPWFVDFFGPMAPAAMSIALGLGLGVMPIYLGWRVVASLKANGQKPLVANTIAGIALLTQMGVTGTALYTSPWTLEELKEERGQWLSDWLSGAELAFELDGGGPESELPPKWQLEAPSPPPKIGGDPEMERKELMALIAECKTAGGVSRYLDDETAAALGVRWMVFAQAQFSDFWSTEPAQKARVDQLLKQWKLPVQPAAWKDPSQFKDLTAPDGRRFLLQIDQLAAELSETHGHPKELPPLVPWRDMLASAGVRPVRDDTVWRLNGGKFADIVADSIDGKADYATLYDKDDAEAASWFLLQPDPEFSGPDAAVQRAFLVAIRGDRGLHWKSPALSRGWPDSLTHPAAGRAAARVIGLVSVVEDGDKLKTDLIKRHHLPADLDCDNPPADLTPERGRTVLAAVTPVWAANYEAVLEADKAKDKPPASDRKRRADAESRAFALATTVSGTDEGKRTVSWMDGEEQRTVDAVFEDGVWRFDWP